MLQGTYECDIANEDISSKIDVSKIDAIFKSRENAILTIRISIVSRALIQFELQRDWMVVVVPQESAGGGI
ncbi:MAG: hypothetical protein JRN15_02525 [Nitrososphaerota archaeon]|nr:hypothetical protein [Nitrososphaerota archaeon]